MDKAKLQLDDYSVKS